MYATMPRTHRLARYENLSEAQALLSVMEIKGIITEQGGEVKLV